MLLLATLFAAGICGCDGAAELPSTPLPQTQNIYLEGDFAFTISPDDQWMLFYERQNGTGSDIAKTQLRLLNLDTQSLHRVALPSDGSVWGLGGTTARWSADSRYYLYGNIALAFDDDGPRLIEGLEKVWPQRSREPERWRVPDQDVVLTMDGHCSDCHEYERLVTRRKLLNTALGEGQYERNERKTIVSHDGNVVYFQKGRGSGTVRIYARKIKEDTDRLLATHRGPCVGADYLRVSPNGRYLAYQFSTGCAFAQPPRLYIVDLATDRQWFVKSHAYKTMHWTSDSSRLYFVSRDTMQSPLVVHYVDVPRNDDADEPDGATGGQADEGDDQR